jgi:tetratricopeptide (TPR) repeat protein
VIGNAHRLLAILSLVGALLGCHLSDPSEADVTKSEKRLAIAKDFLSKRQLEGAENETNRAIALNPRNDEAYNLRGLINVLRAYETQRTLEVDGCLTGVDAEATHQDLDQFLKKADEDFDRATKLSPDYGEAWSNRGVVHNLLDDYSTSVAYLSKALEHPFRLVNPGLTRAHLGWALFHQHKLVEAAKELRQVKQFDPKMCVASYRLGRVYFERDEWEKAAELFEAVSHDPSCGSQEASLYLMQTRMNQGLADEARTARDACVKLAPQSCIASQCRANGGALGTVSPVPNLGSGRP